LKVIVTLNSKEYQALIKQFKEKVSSTIIDPITRANQPTPPRNPTVKPTTEQRIKRTFKTIANNVMVKPFPICLMR